MAKKRKSGGRAKGGKGVSKKVQCASCGRMVPADKAKKRTRHISLVDYRLSKELRDEGTYIPRKAVTQSYCVSCAVHRGQVKVRSKIDRKT